MITFQTQFEVTRDGSELLIDITGTIDPYMPSRGYGPWDTDSPPEGGTCELSDATYNGQPFRLTADEQVEAERCLYEEWEGA